MRKIRKIIIHCTANRPHCKMKPSDFLRLKANTHTGYHYIIFEDGYVWQMEPLTNIANHCRHHNADSVGIAYVGGLNEHNVTTDTRTVEQKAALRALLIKLLRSFPVPIYGHRHFNNGKVCPCFDADTEYKDLLSHLP